MTTHRDQPPSLDAVLSSSPAIHYAMALEPDRLRPLLLAANLSEQLGWHPEQCTSTPDWWLNKLHPEDRSRVLGALPALRQQRHWSIEYRIGTADGGYRNILDSGRVIDTGESCWVSGIWLLNEQQPPPHSEQLALLETLRRVDDIMFGSNDLDSVLSELLQLTLQDFHCDRAWLLHPCNPDDSHWQVPMERTREGWDGAFSQGTPLPVTNAIAASFREALACSEPIRYGEGTGKAVPDLVAKQFAVKSRMVLAVRPPLGAPWLFGIHYCASHHAFTRAEVAKFRAVGERLGEALRTQLLLRQLNERQRRYQHLFEQAPISLWEEDASSVKTYLDGILDPDVTNLNAWFNDHPEQVAACAQRLQVLDVNRATVELYAASSKQELLGNLDKTFTKQSLKAFQQELVALYSGQTRYTAEAQTRSLNGRDLTVRARVALAPDSEHDWSHMLVAITDITAHAEASAKVHNLNRTLRLVGDCTQALMRANNVDELLDAACREIVDEAGYCFAWVGLIDESDPGQRVQLGAHAGDDHGYLAQQDRSWDDTANASNPTVCAVHARTAIVCQSDQFTTECRPCLAQARALGFPSSVALPLIDQQHLFGSLNIYSLQQNAFSETELTLLQELATDMAYGIRVLRDRVEQTRTAAWLQALYDASPDMIFIHDRNGDIIDVNHHVVQTFGYPSRASFLATPLTALMGAGFDHREVLDKLRNTATGSADDFDWKARHHDGHDFDVEVRLRRLDQHGRVLALVRDISERKSLQARLAQQAYYDELTGLPNRRLAMERMARALAVAQREQHDAALMLLDLDNFKQVNDTYGHGTGDHLLIGVAERLNTAVRSSDTVARLGGDEFLILIGDIREPNDVLNLADKILRLLDHAMVVDGHDLIVSTSIGIARYPDDGIDADTLFKAADSAMYKAKHEGRNTYRFFSSELNQHMQRYMAIGAALHHAVSRNELQLHYQPVVDHAGQAQGVEVLLRWHHPRLGQISPAEFIPIAEDRGMIIGIGHRVLKQACAQLQAWQAAGLPLQWIAVNLSPRQFWKQDLVTTVANVLQASGLDGRCLKLELTEGLLLNHSPEALSTLNQLRSLGVHLSLDDFGTGYSSLSYLQQYPFDSLKIDRSFATNLPANADNLALTRTIIAMARGLGLQVIAEGVETSACAQVLIDEGCNLLQGYLYSPALPAQQLSDWVVSASRSTSKIDPL